MKLIREIKALYNWHSALWLASKGRYDRALHKLYRASPLYGSYFEYCILRGSVERMMGNFTEGIRLSSIALEQLSNEADINEDEEKYLKFYSQTLMAKCSKNLGFENRALYAEVMNTPDITISNVRQSYLKYFPIVIH